MNFWRYSIARFFNRNNRIMGIINLVVMTLNKLVIVLCCTVKGSWGFSLILFSQTAHKEFYEGFEINDHTGTQLSDDNVVLVHHFLIEAFSHKSFMTSSVKFAS